MNGIPKANHYAVVDDDIIEWIADMAPEASMAMMRRIAIAEELGQKDIVNLLHKWIRGWASSRGRVNKVFEIARNQEAINVASEVFAPRRGV